ncbi:MAG: peptide transporter [Alphaproteobacteria bacterium 33-17]|nr:MAG: peptide transporter [Alphaproteobacteria bacterium 33-17]
MTVISILNQKGGAGKTTLATNIAKGLQLEGHKVLLVDSDPQGSARDWSAANENCSITVVGIDRPTIDRDIKNIKSQYEYIVIDGAPQAHDLAVSAIKASDLVLIPVQPSPYDIWAAEALVNLVKQRIEITNGELKAAFVISRAIYGTKIGESVVEALSGYELDILKTRTFQRVVYSTTAAQGLSVFESAKQDEAAMDEISNIIQEAKMKLKEEVIHD